MTPHEASNVSVISNEDSALTGTVVQVYRDRLDLESDAAFDMDAVGEARFTVMPLADRDRRRC